MLPEIIARNIQKQVEAYINATFEFKEESLVDAFQKFLFDEGDGILKGPWVDLKFPFEKALSDYRIPFSFGNVFHPYEHQRIAWERLLKGKHSIITTGTGSGKTECFLYPVLEKALENKKLGKKGISTIVLYPMNALATDQEKRFAKTISETPELNGIRVGTFVGRKDSKNGTREMGKENGITHQETLRKDPPDILLTNYKMLDYLLMRPVDFPLWRFNQEGTLSYIILDELHTYDGVQGTDVACLIRRLKDRLDSKQNKICFVGTSATLDRDTKKTFSGQSLEDTEEAMDTSEKKLAEFASLLSGEEIGIDAIIGESRLGYEFLLSDESPLTVEIPEVGELVSRAGESKDEYIHRICELWKVSPDPVELGNWMRRTDLFRMILEVYHREKENNRVPILWKDDLCVALGNEFPSLLPYSQEEVEIILLSFFSLLHHAKRREGKKNFPLLPAQIQIWIREVRRVGRVIDSEQERFVWLDEKPDSIRALPGYHCRECGESGYVALEKSGTEGEVAPRYGNTGFLIHDYTQPKEIYKKFLIEKKQERDKQIVLFRKLRNSDVPDPTTDCFFSASQRMFFFREEGKTFEEVRDAVRVRLNKDLKINETGVEVGIQSCPDCGSFSGPLFIGIQAATLSSVCVDEIFSSPLNEDAKLLAFTDNVQDASHRAAYFSARTYSFVFRSILFRTLIEEGKNLPVRQAIGKIFEYTSKQITKLFPANSDFNTLATLLPPDMENWSDWGKYLEDRAFITDPELQRKLKDRILFGMLTEFTSTIFSGRSLEWTGAATIGWNRDVVELASTEIHSRLERISPLLRNVSQEKVTLWVHGILLRLKDRSCFQHPFIESLAKDNFWGKNPFGTRAKDREHFPNRGDTNQIPYLLSTKPEERKSVIPLFSSHSENKSSIWMDTWCRRALGIGNINEIKQNEINDIKQIFLKVLLEKNLLIKLCETGKNTYYALSTETMYFTTDTVLLYTGKETKKLVLDKNYEDLWIGAPSMEFREDDKTYSKTSTSVRQDYFSRRYRTGVIRKVNALEHTGLLETEDRENREKEFIKTTNSHSPNVMTCTSTLEMGIDIGDLSATMLCSIPPGVSNYLQRIGRAGRSTGAALIIGIVNQVDHDLFFYSRPGDLLRGKINSPGIWLNAPAVLKRQYFGYCMDRATKEKIWVEMVGTLGSLNKEIQDRNSSIHKFIQWQKENHSLLLKDFLSLFPVLNDFTLEKLNEIKDDDLQNEITTISLQTGNLLSNIKSHITAIQEKLKDNLTDERLKDELTRDLYFFKARDRSIRSTLFIEALTNEGILPNYAFPEKGVVFEGHTQGVGNNSEFISTGQVIRPAGIAIRELAPRNHFYINRRKFIINQYHLRNGEEGTSVNEAKRICGNCGYLLEDTVSEHLPEKCPQCGYPSSENNSLVEQEQRQLFLPIHNSITLSRMDFEKSYHGDSKDDREKAYYNTIRIFDSTLSLPYDQLGKPESDFAMEYFDKIKLMDVNCGYSNEKGSIYFQKGKPMPAGFYICEKCGRTLPPNGEYKLEEAYKFHSNSCKKLQMIQKKKRKNREGSEHGFERSYIYRELVSEAIRMNVPNLIEENLKTFVACSQLGMKLKFKGNPGHVVIDIQNIPDHTNDFSRFYLVMMDMVPGGTGFLKSLYKEKSEDGRIGEGIFDLFKRAYQHLVDCECGKIQYLSSDEDPDGCYRCIRSYEMQYSFKEISRRKGIKILEEILPAIENRIPIQMDISEIGYDRIVDSQLEKKFLKKLEDAVKNKHLGQWDWVTLNGKQGAQFNILENLWRIIPQKTLNQLDNVEVQSLPDFVFEPISDSKDIKKIAVFIDGYTYHLHPHNRINDDCRKRMSILDSKEFLVFTIVNEDWESEGIHLPLFDVEILSKLKEGFSHPDLIPHKGAFQSTFQQLFQYLQYPMPKVNRPSVYNLLFKNQVLLERDIYKLDLSSGDGILTLNMMKTGHQVRVRLLFDDEVEIEKIELYKKNWIDFWKLANLFQFFQLELIPISKANSDSDSYAGELAESDQLGYDEEWALILNGVSNPLLKNFIRKIGKLGFSKPILGFAPDPEEELVTILGFEHEKILVIPIESEPYRKEMEGFGYSVYLDIEIEKKEDEIFRKLKGETI
ncbi:MAG: DEAD/DEAH box helicase [Leptospiraceae bacterium]|nr:DEAD/DEAH box helicase [Leptospiraceae bacterium]MCP5513375.1 DEAD/DEAH box helicase [Leptospiraceae bacterium]